MRIIDADESLKRINNIFPRRIESDYQKGIAVGMAMAKVAINEQPTVDVEPVRHGRWIIKPDPYGFFDEIPVCSECGCTTKMRETYHYCPNCGAKMEVEDGKE